MTGTNLQDVYNFQVRGNWRRELDALGTKLDKAGTGFQTLRTSIGASRADFRASESALRKMAAAGDGASLAAERAKPVMESVAKASRTQAEAYNQLVRDINRANRVRVTELQVLEQVTSKAQPRIIAARAEARALKTLTRALEEDTAARRLQALAQEAGVQLTADGARVFDAQAVAMKRATKAAQELAVANLLAAQGLDPQGKPQTQKAAPATVSGPLPRDIAARLSAEEELAARQKAAADLRNQSIKSASDALRGQEQQARRVAGAVEEVGQAGHRADTIFGRFLFTFRRLVGVFAVFAAARAVTRGFSEMVRGAIEFNAQLEQNRVGLAGLISASGQVLGPAGERLSLEQQLNAAQDLSIEQMRKLRIAAIKTVATYEDLSDALSQSVAPGLSTGLNLDQIREITVSISQAAAGLGVAQNQLSEEIRALFQGTITPRNTRIATALGITNADIRRAKELGNLAGFLKTRFEAISRSGDRLAKTFAGQLNAAQDAFKQLIAESSKPLFEQLKAGLGDFSQAIFDVQADEPIIKPEALKLLDRLFIGLAAGVRNIRAAFSQLDIQGFSEVFGTLGNSLGTAATLLASAFSVAFRVATPLFTVINAILSTINSIVYVVRQINDATGGLAGNVGIAYAKILLFVRGWDLARRGATRVWTLLRGVLTSMTGISLATTAATTGMTALGRAAAAVRTVLLSLGTPIFAIVAGVAILAEAISQTLFDFSLFGALGDAFAYVSKQLDDVINKMLGVKQEAETLSGDGFGIVINQFRDLSAEVDQAVIDIQKSLRAFEASASQDVRLYGASSELASRLREIEQYRLAKVEERAAIERQIKQTQAEQASLVERLYRDDEEFSRVNQAQIKNLQYTTQVLQEQAALEKRIKDLRASPEQPFDGGTNSREMAILEAEQALAKFNAELNLADSGFGNALRDQEAGKKLLEEASKAQILSQSLLNAKNEETNKLLALQKDLLDGITSAELRRFNLTSELQQRQAAEGLSETILEAARVSSLVGVQSESQRAALQAVAEVRSLELARAQDLLTVTRDIALLEAKREEFAKKNGEEATAAVANANAEIALKRQQAAAQDALNLAKIAEAREEQRLANLRATGTVSDGFRETLRKLSKDKQSFFLIGENLAQGLFTGIPQTLGSIVSDAVVNGFNSENARQAVLSLFGNVVGQFVSDVFTNLLAQLFPQKAIAPAVDTAQLAAVNVAAANVTAAAAATSTTISGALFAGAQAITAAGFAAASAIIAASGATGLAGVGQGGLTGFLGPAHGGAVKGFARGGRARRRPLGMDPRDTVPAFLRPGEWVIRPEAVQHYGHQLFAMLNSRKLNRGALPSINKAVSVPTVPKFSFATGGKVSSTSTAPAASFDGPSVVLQFHDEQTMDRALAAGQSSMVRFTRNNRASMRAALGLGSRG